MSLTQVPRHCNEEKQRKEFEKNAVARLSTAIERREVDSWIVAAVETLELCGVSGLMLFSSFIITTITMMIDFCSIFLFKQTKKRNRLCSLYNNIVCVYI